MKDSREGTTCWVRERMTVEELILLLASKVSKRGIYVQKCKLIKNCKRLGYHGRSCSLFSLLPSSPLFLFLSSLPLNNSHPPMQPTMRPSQQMQPRNDLLP